ncbi:Cys-tRNA(Pro) deacylase [Pseudomonas syringae pv. actinidiae]|uniref:Cys-tRNA(Pro) deacylase n=1 Tax=Pseudomonas syringae pv. actinidiae TaxID=103796 RepID=A0A2V0QIC8_PSESF|nr:Cys-tRNA(Pro) deacylase [Pseudomonas syringae pv. actinidiae]
MMVVPNPLERRMTPALDLLKKNRAEHRIHSYEHDPKAPSYGLEAAEKLGLEAVRVFKTLLASTERGELLVAVVPVVGTLDLKALANAAGVKKNRNGRPCGRSALHRIPVGGHQPAGSEKALAHLYRRDGAAF